MIEKYLSEKNEINLFKIPVTIQTKNGDFVNLEAVFHFSKPAGSTLGTVITSHGAPGSHRDFKNLTSKLEEFGVRVVSVNFPGCGYTKYDERLQNDNDERIQFVQQIIDSLKLDKNIIFLGHSRGSENSIKMAANNLEKTSCIILVNPIGIRPHRGASPIIVPVILTFFWKILWLRWFTNWLQHLLYNKIAKLKIKTGEICGVTTSLLAGLDYTDVLPYIKKVDESKIPVIILYGGKDWIVQASVSRELKNCFSNNVEITSENAKDDDEIVVEIERELKKGKKAIGVFCENDGHFIQRTRASLISDIILANLDHRKRPMGKL